MQKLERLREDVVSFHDKAKEVTGEFLYAPFGIETTPFVNAVTLYAILAVLAFGIYRLTRPAPHPRTRPGITGINKYDFGRDA